jgi:hypothetical protein
VVLFKASIDWSVKALYKSVSTFSHFTIRRILLF